MLADNSTGLMLKKNRVEKTFVISLSLHLLMLLGVSMRFPKPKPEQKLEIAFFEPQKKRPNLKRIEQAPKPALKMVSQEHTSELEKELRAAKYFSEQDQKVENETRVVKQGRFKNSKSASNEKRTVANSDVSIKKGAKKAPPLGAVDDEDESATDEHIVADKGLVTLVNSKAFKYYAYCKRIKDKIQTLWEPQIKSKVMKHFGKNRFAASVDEEEHTTKAIIILDAQGILESVQVIGSSGLEDMDESAVEAFRAASPFPNPPLGIIDPDGKIRIRWDFVLSDTK